MDYLGKELLDFLATAPLKAARNELCNLLEACDDEVNVYYLTPLPNLRSIVADRGIKCRAMVSSDAADLSGQEVQRLRDKSLNLAKKVTSDARINKRIHECINFFWNPSNDTSYAFQRRSLLLAADKQDEIYGIICILEMRLSTFLSMIMYIGVPVNKI